MSEQNKTAGGSEHLAALLSDAPKLYVNGFSLGLSNADCNIVLVRNSEPQAVVNMSYTTAKTLALSLTRLVAGLEEATGRDMMTVDVVEQALSAAGMEEAK